MTKALVIGGSGFIGLHLLRRLVADGTWAAIVSVDIADPTERLAGVDYRRHDAREALPQGLADADTVVFNLVALRTFPGHPQADYVATNVGTTRRILDLARATGVRTIVFTSTMSVYPTGPLSHDEGSVLAPDNVYGSTKLEAEGLHRDWLAEDPARHLVICRPAVIFGFRDNGNFTRLSNALRRGFFPYVGRRDVIKSAGYVGDLVESFGFALGHPDLARDRLVVYNFAYPERLTVERIVRAFCKVCGYRPFTPTLPRPLLDAAAVPFEWLDRIGLRNPIHRKRIVKLVQGTDIVPGWLVAAGFRFSTTLDEGLARWKEECGDKPLF